MKFEIGDKVKFNEETLKHAFSEYKGVTFIIIKISENNHPFPYYMKNKKGNEIPVKESEIISIGENNWQGRVTK